MRYRDYLKIYMEFLVWFYSGIIVAWSIACYFRSMDTIEIPIDVIPKILSTSIIVSIGHWYFESRK